MTDHAEEQEMEAEALTAIFDQHFNIVNKASWTLDIYPETGDPSELDQLNHVACRLHVQLPSDYPETLPELTVKVIKGLADEHRDLLQDIANQEAEANMGGPSIFAIGEKLREWLSEHNQKGLDDISMHAQMMRKRLEQEKAKVSSMSVYMRVYWFIYMCICICIIEMMRWMSMLSLYIVCNMLTSVLL
jgi:RWD domain